MRNPKRENVPTQRSRWSVPKLLGPEGTQLTARQPIKALDIDVQVSSVMRVRIYPLMVRRLRQRAAARGRRGAWREFNYGRKHPRLGSGRHVLAAASNRTDANRSDRNGSEMKADAALNGSTPITTGTKARPF